MVLGGDGWPQGPATENADDGVELPPLVTVSTFQRGCCEGLGGLMNAILFGYTHALPLRQVGTLMSTAASRTTALQA